MKKLSAALVALSLVALPSLASTAFDQAMQDPRGIKYGKCAVAASFTDHPELGKIYRGELQQLLDEYALTDEERSQVAGYLIGRSAGRFGADPAAFAGTDKKTAAENYLMVHC